MPGAMRKGFLRRNILDKALLNLCADGALGINRMGFKTRTQGDKGDELTLLDSAPAPCFVTLEVI